MEFKIHPGLLGGEDSTLCLKNFESISIHQLPENITINSKNSNLEILNIVIELLLFLVMQLMKQVVLVLNQ